MKKFFCLVLTFIFAVTIAGCSDTSSKKNSSNSLSNVVFQYPTYTTVQRALNMQAEIQGLTLPELSVTEYPLMDFYTYDFNNQIKLILKIKNDDNTLLNIEIATPQELSTEQIQLRDKLMYMVAASIETHVTKEELQKIAESWKNVETNSGGYASPSYIVYTKELHKDSNMYNYYAKL